jgi:hypothetical protein
MAWFVYMVAWQAKEVNKRFGGLAGVHYGQSAAVACQSRGSTGGALDSAHRTRSEAW